MAKISKKNPSAAFEVGKITRLVSESIADTLGLVESEPITHIPNVDMFSTAKELIIEVEIPGVRKDDIEVLLHKNSVTIKALKYDCFDEDKINYVCMERVFGRIFRSIEVPFPVDTAKIKAIYKSGILTIVIPKVEDKRSKTRRVAIESV